MKTRAEKSVRFRADVEGMRAVAIGLVLLYHAGVPLIPGGFVGVDVFFVISGFLITGLLTTELRESGTISLGRFYARRAKRLLPAASLVLVTTVVVTFWAMPETVWRQTGGDVIASALYVVNWRLASRSVDYLAQDSAESPVQHYWSLAVEEQYYLLWPLLLLVVSLAARRRGKPISRSLWVGLAAVAVPSFVWCVYWTSREPAAAFFATTTRMWELALGGGVALAAAPFSRLPRLPAAILGWSGLIAIAASALVFSTTSSWPGYAALLPTLGAAAVIAAGPSAGSAGPIALLGTGPFTWIGGLSYSIYLWHWPLIVWATVLLDGLTAWQGLAVALAAVVPAWLTYRFVENPIRYSRRFAVRPTRALRLGAGLTTVGVTVGAVPVVVVAAQVAAPARPPKVEPLGAVALDAHPNRVPTRVKVVVPDPLAVSEDVPDAYDRECQVKIGDPKPVSCTYGDPDGALDMVVVGDSKMLQWISAFDMIGKKYGWRIRTFTKATCSFSDAVLSRNDRPYKSCMQWNAAVLETFREDPPDVMVTSQGSSIALIDPERPDLGTSSAAMVRGLRSRWTTMTELGTHVVVLLDNPVPIMPMAYWLRVYDCVADHRDDLPACSFDRDEGVRRSAAEELARAARGLPGVDVIDLTDYFCVADTCPPVIGNVLIYRSGSHITNTYIKSLATPLERVLVPIVERGPLRAPAAVGDGEEGSRRCAARAVTSC